jgi:ACS family hexuronate transporter-like MFS transporter
MEFIKRLRRPETRRWLIVAIIFLAIVFNYIDRQIVSVLKPVLKADFGLDDSGYAVILNLFTICYAVMYPVTGWLVDRFGARLIMFWGIITWSLACIGGGLSRTVGQFGFFRALLGAAEPTNFPAQLKVIAVWFPGKLRATANSLCVAGSSIGAIIAPPAIAWLALTYNWQTAFIVMGAFGMVIAVLWKLVYKDPPAEIFREATEATVSSIVTESTLATEATISNQSSIINQPSIATASTIANASTFRTGSIKTTPPISNGSNGSIISTDSTSPPSPATPFIWRQLWGTRSLWGIILIRFVSDPVWYFCLFWLPGYLQEKSGLSLAQVGMFGWIPFLFADLGAIGTSAWSDKLVRKGYEPLKARKKMLTTVAFIAPLCIVTPYLGNAGLTLAVFSIVAIACLSWLFTISVVVAETFPVENVASVLGIAAGFGALGAVGFNYFVGQFIGTLGAEKIFIVMAFLHPLAAIILKTMVKKEKVKSI